MCWFQHCFNTNTTVRAFFCLQKKPSLTLNCAFFGEAFWLHLFLEKGGNAPPRLPAKSKFENQPLPMTYSTDKSLTANRLYLDDSYIDRGWVEKQKIQPDWVGFWS